MRWTALCLLVLLCIGGASAIRLDRRAHHASKLHPVPKKAATLVERDSTVSGVGSMELDVARFQQLSMQDRSLSLLRLLHAAGQKERPNSAAILDAIKRLREALFVINPFAQSSSSGSTTVISPDGSVRALPSAPRGFGLGGGGGGGSDNGPSSTGRVALESALQRISQLKAALRERLATLKGLDQLVATAESEQHAAGIWLKTKSDVLSELQSLAGQLSEVQTTIKQINGDVGTVQEQLSQRGRATPGQFTQLLSWFLLSTDLDSCPLTFTGAELLADDLNAARANASSDPAAAAAASPAAVSAAPPAAAASAGEAAGLGGAAAAAAEASAPDSGAVAAAASSPAQAIAEAIGAQAAP